MEITDDLRTAVCLVVGIADAEPENRQSNRCAWDDACAGEFQNTLGNIPPGLFQNPPTYKTQDCETDDNSDTDSVAEYIAWDDACAGEFQNMLGNIPPGLVQNPPTDKIRNYGANDISDTDSVAELNYSAGMTHAQGIIRIRKEIFRIRRRYRMMIRTMVQMQTPSRSWNIKLGRTHAHGGVRVSW